MGYNEVERSRPSAMIALISVALLVTLSAGCRSALIFFHFLSRLKTPSTNSLLIVSYRASLATKISKGIQGEANPSHSEVLQIFTIRRDEDDIL